MHAAKEWQQHSWYSISEEVAESACASKEAARGIVYKHLADSVVHKPRVQNITVVDEESATAFVYCTVHCDCLHWRVKVAKGDAPGGSLVRVDKAGTASDVPRVVRGETVEKRDFARTMAHQRPTQSFTQLVEDGTPSGACPKYGTMRKQREGYLHRQAGTMYRTTKASGVWRLWLEELQRNNRPWRTIAVTDWVHIKAAGPVDDSWLPAAALRACGTVCEGASVFLNKAMVEFVRRVVAAGGIASTGKGALVMDLSFKLNAAGFGLACVGLPAKYLDRGLWRTQCLPAAFGWGPKDDAPTWISIMVTVFDFYRQLGIDLRAWVKWLFWDETKGGRRAQELLCPADAPFCPDLRHKTSACRKLSHQNGGRPWGDHLAGNVQFLSAVQTVSLVSIYVAQFLAELERDAPAGCVSYSKSLFRRSADTGLWTT